MTIILSQHISTQYAPNKSSALVASSMKDSLH